MKTKKIKAKFGNHIGYSVWDSESNELIAVIGYSRADEGKTLDITEKFKTIIQNHFCADKVKIDSCPLEVIDSTEIHSGVVICVSTIEEGEKCARNIELHSITIY